MPHHFGKRMGTRYMFARAYRKHGVINHSTYLTNYKIGEYVDIVVNGAQHKGMPYKVYHGKTGVVFNVNPNSVGVIVNKQVRQRIEKKRVHVRVEHIRHSTCNDNFKTAVRANEERKRNSKEKASTKRVPALPRQSFIVDPSSATVHMQNPKFHQEIF